jgi:hypothetical protein
LTKSSPASEGSLNELHEALAAALKKRIDDGTATAADLSVARQFLKDQGIEAIRTPDSPLDGLANSLPFATAEGVLNEQETQH